MKLRTTRNSIRLRLSQTDVTKFAETGVVEEIVQIGPGTTNSLSYRLVRSEAVDTTKAQFEQNCLIVLIPSDRADQWSTSEEVSIETSQPTGSGGELSILIEKDFACLTRRVGDDDKDAFPNPGVACA